MNLGKTDLKKWKGTNPVKNLKEEKIVYISFVLAIQDFGDGIP